MVTVPPREPFEVALGPVYDEFLTGDFEKDWLQKIGDINCARSAVP